jgi:peptidoglycan/LPS O-acetylase OafA/YrhL
LRGIAALAVVLFHVSHLWTYFRFDNAMPPVWGSLRDFLAGAGASSVTLFFVISGLVLRQSLDAKRDGSLPVICGQFLIARAFRIYPLVVVVVLTWVATARWLPFPEGAVYDWPTIVRNVALAEASIDWPTWSTRVEIAAIPFILIAWTARRKFGIVALIGIAAAFSALAFWRSLYCEDMIGRYLASFALGMLILDLPETLGERIPAWLAIPVMGVLLAACVCARPYVSYHSQWAILIESICWTGFLFLLVKGNSGAIRPALLTTPLRFIGKISFSIFLVHFFVLCVLLRHLPASWLSVVSGGDPMTESSLVFAMTMMVSVPLSAATYAAVEAPGIAAGRSVRLLLWNLGRRDAQQSAAGPVLAA